eukprot:CAMPEP_0170536990 /NCGR_PEP_ID=MMETSP0209-20121228/102446_1 /TAXON_ID=665100 ORGANISM="Litonotus pictus, Strain P1" /NCGR_SAMPLE_ID=MMETSP0209 /ASSEMBLY_ACC=CAM_ASM_000301 /LENGTH=2144 /DNA_ID=CAMNT_0010838425 /DNA_START=10797 /DNA_END=17233 /DNA_ORIENTATION=+
MVVNLNNKEYKVSPNKCSFNSIKVWNIVTVNMSLQETGLLLTLQIYDLEQSKLQTFSSVIPNDNFSRPNLELLDYNGAFGVNPGSDNDIFEVANVYAIEFIPDIADIKEKFSSRDILCDNIECKNCPSNKPSQCSACYNRDSNDSGIELSYRKSNFTLEGTNKKNSNSSICAALFIPLKSNGVTFTNLNWLSGKSKRLSSNNYSFSGIYYARNTLAEDTKTEIDLFNGGYFQDSLQQNVLRVSLLDKKIQVYVGENTKVVHSTELEASSWYSIMVTVSGTENILTVYTFKITSKVTGNVKFDSKQTYPINEPILRMTEALQTKQYTDKLNSVDLRLYINSAISVRTAKNIVRNFDYPQNCSSVDESLSCLTCKEGFVAQQGTSNCVRKEWSTSGYERVGNVYSVYEGLPDAIPLTTLGNLDLSGDNLVIQPFSIIIYMRRMAFGFNKDQEREVPLVSLDDQPIIFESIDKTKTGADKNNGYSYILDLSAFSGNREVISNSYETEKFDYSAILITFDIKSSGSNIEVSLYDYARNIKSRTVGAVINSINDGSYLVFGSVEAKHYPTEIGPLYNYHSLLDHAILDLAPKPSEYDPGCANYDFDNKICKRCEGESGGINVSECGEVETPSLSYELRSKADYNRAMSNPFTNSYGYSLYDNFRHGVHSTSFSLYGFFKVNSIRDADLNECVPDSTQNKTCKALLWRLSNWDHHNSLTEYGIPVDREGEGAYNHDLNLLGMNISSNEGRFSPEILLSSYPKSKSKRHEINDIKFSANTWINFYISFDADKKQLNVLFYDTNYNKIGDLKTIDLDADSTFGRLESFSTLKFFGIDSSKKKPEVLFGEVHDVKVLVNRGYIANMIPSYFSGSDSSSQTVTIEDDTERLLVGSHHQSKCEISNCYQCSDQDNKQCIQCKEGYTIDPNSELIGGSCISLQSQSYIFLSNENYQDGSNNNSLVNGNYEQGFYRTKYSLQNPLNVSFGYAFWMRRNFFPSSLSNRKPMVIIGEIFKLTFFSSTYSSSISFGFSSTETVEFNLGNQSNYDWTLVKGYTDYENKRSTLVVGDQKASKSFSPDVDRITSQNISVFTYNGEINITKLAIINEKIIDKELTYINKPESDADSVYKISPRVCETDTVQNILDIINIKKTSPNPYDYKVDINAYNMLEGAIKDNALLYSNSKSEHKCVGRTIKIPNIVGVQAEALSSDRSSDVLRTNKVLVSDHLPSNLKLIRFKKFVSSFQAFIPANYSGNIFKVYKSYTAENTSQGCTEDCLLSIGLKNGEMSIIVNTSGPQGSYSKILRHTTNASVAIFMLSFSGDRLTYSISSMVDQEGNHNFNDSIELESSSIDYLTGASVFQFGLNKTTDNSLVTYENITLNFDTAISNSSLNSLANHYFKQLNCGTSLGVCKFCFDSDQILNENGVCNNNGVKYNLLASRFKLGGIITENKKTFSKMEVNNENIAEIEFYYRRPLLFGNYSKTNYGVLKIGDLTIVDMPKAFALYYPAGEGTNDSVKTRSLLPSTEKKYDKKLGGKRNIILIDKTGLHLNQYSHFYHFKIVRGNDITIFVGKPSGSQSIAQFKGSFSSPLTIDTIPEGKVAFESNSSINIKVQSIVGAELYQLNVYTVSNSDKAILTSDINQTSYTTNSQTPLINSEYQCNKKCAGGCKNNFCSTRLSNSDTPNDILHAVKNNHNKETKCTKMQDVFAAIASNNNSESLNPEKLFGESNISKGELKQMIDANANNIEIDNFSMGVTFKVNSEFLGSNERKDNEKKKDDDDDNDNDSEAGKRNAGKSSGSGHGSSYDNNKIPERKDNEKKKEDDDDDNDSEAGKRNAGKSSGSGHGSSYDNNKIPSDIVAQPETQNEVNSVSNDNNDNNHSKQGTMPGHEELAIMRTNQSSSFIELSSELESERTRRSSKQSQEKKPIDLLTFSNPLNSSSYTIKLQLIKKNLVFSINGIVSEQLFEDFAPSLNTAKEGDQVQVYFTVDKALKILYTHTIVNDAIFTKTFDISHEFESIYSFSCIQTHKSLEKLNFIPYEVTMERMIYRKSNLVVSGDRFTGNDYLPENSTVLRKRLCSKAQSDGLCYINERENISELLSCSYGYVKVNNSCEKQPFRITTTKEKVTYTATNTNNSYSQSKTKAAEAPIPLSVLKD